MTKRVLIIFGIVFLVAIGSFFSYRIYKIRQVEQKAEELIKKREDERVQMVALDALRETARAKNSITREEKVRQIESLDVLREEFVMEENIPKEEKKQNKRNQMDALDRLR